MGLGVYLEYANGKTAEVKSHQYGSTIAIGGSTTADCTITYNYSKFYWDVFGKSLADVLEGQKAKCPKCGSNDLTVVRYPEHLFSYHEICNNCGWSDLPSYKGE